MDGHGLTRREQQLLDLQERGLDPGRIPAELGLKRSYVAKTLSRLGGPGSDGGWDSMVRLGSERLLAAIRRHHPDRCA